MWNKTQQNCSSSLTPYFLIFLNHNILLLLFIIIKKVAGNSPSIYLASKPFLSRYFSKNLIFFYFLRYDMSLCFLNVWSDDSHVFIVCVCVLLTGSERPILDWPKRMKIAIGSARGLAYLHDGCKYILHLCYDIYYLFLHTIH